MAKKTGRTEKQQLMKKYASFLLEETKSAEIQQRLEKEASDAYWASVLAAEDFRIQQLQEQNSMHMPQSSSYDYEDYWPEDFF